MKQHWIKDPSVQFALIGALLFGINSLFQDRQSASSDDIFVSEARVQHISAIFERNWQRPPTTEELRSLIGDYVREEVLYRAALNMGLDQDDAVIRQRLRTKVERLAEDLADAIEPAEPVLKQYHQNNLNRYTRPARYSFSQIFLDSNKRAEVAEDARIVLTRLTAGRDPRDLGDRSLLDYQFESITPARIDRVFGSDFSLQLTDIPINEWTGPLTSAYGEHLVRIRQRDPQLQPEFAEVRAEVLRDWQEEERRNALQTQYETLRRKYDISIVELPLADSVKPVTRVADGSPAVSQEVVRP